MVMKMLAYGATGDTQDNYLHLSESIAINCLNKFCRAVVRVFGPKYLRPSNAEDTAWFLAINEARGFAEILGSIDYMHCV